jgi:RNA polymerase sigma-70 factor (ECF subfamily)
LPAPILHNENELLLQVAAGSERAFQVLFDCYHGKVYGTALKFLKSPEVAEEVVQDVFLKIWLKREEMPSVERFNAYLFIMTRNTIFNRIKKAAYEVSVQKEIARNFSEIDDQTENLLRDRQYQKILQEAMNLLPPQQKQVYHLAKVEGLSHEAIAERMQISRLTVKTHMAKALQTIRTYLTHHLHCSTSIALLSIIMKLSKV